MGSLSLLQGIFPTKGSNPGLLHCKQILYQLSHKGSHKVTNSSQGVNCWPTFSLRAERNQLPGANYALGAFPRKDKWLLSDYNSEEQNTFGVGNSWIQNCLELLLPLSKLFELCPTLCNPIDGSPPCSPVSGTLQARILEWVAISYSNAWKWKVKVKSLSHVWFLASPWTAVYQAPRSMGFSRQEYWSGVPLPSPVWSSNTC